MGTQEWPWVSQDRADGPAKRLPGPLLIVLRLQPAPGMWENLFVTYNFSSGPAMLPLPVVARIQRELPSWGATGQPVMALSHRSAEIANLMRQVSDKLRAALSIPDSHEVLFMHGGGVGQFAAIPLNLTKPGDEIAAIVTGQWGLTAIAEAEAMGVTVNRVSDQGKNRYTRVPLQYSYTVPATSKYLYYVPNETIGGVEFPYRPDSPVPLVADASSQLLSRPMDIGAHGIVFAGTQKNLGVAGATVVIIERSLLGHARTMCPTIMDYAKIAKSGSLLNTPATFAIYVLDLMLDWVKQHGGVRAMEVESVTKADLVYAVIDSSDFYGNPVPPTSRSTKNIPFTMADPSLDAKFLQDSVRAGLLSLEGHRTVGGMRASIYNAMPVEGVLALTAFMLDFERRYG